VSITDHLPEWLGTYAEQVAEELQVPVDAVALLSLGAVSAAVNGGASTMPTAQYGGTWNEPVALYVLTLLGSGEGKSPVFNKLMEPIVNAFEEVTGVHAAADAKYQTIRNRFNRRHIKQVESNCLRAVAKGSMSREEAIAEIAAAEREVALFNSTNIPLKWLSDVTGPGMVDEMIDNEGRVVIATPEAEGITNFRGQSKDAILKGYDGDTLGQSRRGMSVTIARPVVTALVAMQPTVLATLGSDMTDRGLMPRFLYSYPDSLIGHRNSRPKLVTDEAADEYLAEMTRIVTTYSEKLIKIVSWDNAATREIGTWRDELEPEFLAGGMLANLGSWGSKVRGGHFIRLASILAIANGRETVSVGDCVEAKAILRGLMLDAKRAFGRMGGAQVEDDLAHLMGKVNELIEANGGDDRYEFAKREVMRKSNRLTSADRAQAAIDRAIDEGLLEEAGKRTGGTLYRLVKS